MTDPIQTLLDAAANPPRVIGAESYSWDEILWFKNVGIAARNGIRALAEEWLRYGNHEYECMHVLRGCTCGWSARRQQIEAFLEATKPAVCHRCEGDGKAHGADRPFEASGPGTYPGPCPVCKGSGKEPT